MPDRMDSTHGFSFPKLILRNQHPDAKAWMSSDMNQELDEPQIPKGTKFVRKLVNKGKRSKELG